MPPPNNGDNGVAREEEVIVGEAFGMFQHEGWDGYGEQEGEEKRFWECEREKNVRFWECKRKNKFLNLNL